MTDANSEKAGKQNHLDDALSSLRDEYEQSADGLAIEEQSEPKPGREMRGFRFPRGVSYLLGALSVGMLVVAIFLFSAQDKPDSGLSDLTAETAVNEPAAELLPTPPLFSGEIPEAPEPTPAAKPLEETAVAPEPTPWPTPE